MSMHRWLIPLLGALAILGPAAAASDYYFESLSYTIQVWPQGIAYGCSLQFTSLKPGLSEVGLTIPYPLLEISSGPTVILDEKEVDPEISDHNGVTHLVLSFDGKRVGEIGDLDLTYVAGQGITIAPGARIPVRTLGLGGNVTVQALSLKLPQGFTVSRVETPQGVVKQSRSGGVPLDIGMQSVELVFVIRRTTLLDNPYVSLGIVLGSLAVAAGLAVYVVYRRKRMRAQVGQQSN